MQKKTNGATVGYESQLWQMADALRGSMDAAEYMNISSRSSPALRAKRAASSTLRRLVATLREQQAEARRLDETIWKNLNELGYDV